MMAATTVVNENEGIKRLTIIDGLFYEGECTRFHERYTSDLTTHLNTLRKEGTLCDITISVNQRQFKAHKVVLCAASSYFLAMFNSGFQESNLLEITLEGNHEAFERLLNFAYTGVLRLNAELVSDIISMSSYLQFNTVVPMCSKFLKHGYDTKKIGLPVAFNILNLAGMHEFPVLHRDAEKYLAENFAQFSETDVFLEMASHGFVECLLKRNDLVLWVKEEQILKGVITWIKHDWQSRQQSAEPLLRLVQLGQVPVATLKQLVDSDLQAIPECRGMIDEVERCLSLQETSKIPLSFQFPHLFAPRGMVKSLISIDPAGAHQTHYYDQFGWRPLPNFPKLPINHQLFDGHQVVIAQGQLYLVGGRSMDQQVYNNFLRYDEGSNKWEQMEGMRVARSYCATVSVGDYIYVIGGWASKSFVTDVERYNLTENKWEMLESIPKCDSLAVAVVFRDTILVHYYEDKAGYPGGQLGHVVGYDHAEDTWPDLMTYTQLHGMSPILGISSHQLLLLVHEDRLYTVSYRMNGESCVQELVVRKEANGRMIELDIKLPQYHKGTTHWGPLTFCIGEQEPYQHFANLNGYPFKLHPWILKQCDSSSKKAMRDLVQGLEKEACCVEICRRDPKGEFGNPK